MASDSRRWVARHRVAPASPYGALTFHPAGAFTEQTLRQIIHLHRGGTQFRLHISNLFGGDTLAIGPMRVAAHVGGGGIDPSTDVVVTFNGAGSVKIPPGESVLTDPVPVGLPDDSELAASIFDGLISLAHRARVAGTVRGYGAPCPRGGHHPDLRDVAAVRRPGEHPARAHSLPRLLLRGGRAS